MGSVKAKYDRRGRHPHSLANLKPRRKGQPSLNPDGRRGKACLGSQLHSVFETPQWRKLVRDFAKTERMLDRCMQADLGISLAQVDEAQRQGKL